MEKQKININDFKKDLEWIAQSGRMSNARKTYEKWFPIVGVGIVHLLIEQKKDELLKIQKKVKK